MNISTGDETVYVFTSQVHNTLSLLTSLQSDVDASNAFSKGCDFISKLATQSRFELSTESIPSVEDVTRRLQSICNTPELKEALQCNRAIIVYFVPGLGNPVDVYVSWTPPDKVSMRKNIRKLYTYLNRRGFNRLATDYEHLFEFAHAVLMQSSSDSNWCSISMLFNNLPDPQYLKIDGAWYSWTPDVQRHTITQEEIILVTPIIANKESLVILASYYLKDDAREFSSLKDSSEDTYYAVIRHLCEKFAFEVVQQYYAPLLQQNTVSLRKGLERSNISEDFLIYMGRRLEKTRSRQPFTYEFKYGKKNNLSCVDLYGIITKELVSNLPTIYKTVVDIQKSMYESLYDKINGLRVNCGWSFPNSEDIAFTPLVLKVEAAQRELQMKSRDHVIHPFQTFILGTLLIDHYQRYSADADYHFFYQSMKEALDVDTNGNNVDKRTYRHFLRMAWLICATTHDVGYPIQVYDDLSTELRNQVAKLFCLNHDSLGSTEKLRIEQVLYDDPRTVLILRRLSKAVAHFLNLEDEIKNEHGQGFLEDAIFWAIKRMTFDEPRHHEMASTIAVALKFLNNNPKEVIKQNESFSFIERHVLLPIMLHHIYEWPDRLETMKKSFIAMKNSEVDESIVNKGRAGEHLVDFLLKIIRRDNIIKFEKMPLVLLLIICDLFQEWGRPGSSLEGKEGEETEREWPIRIDGLLEGTEELKLTVNLVYDDEHGTQTFQERDYNKRKERVKFLKKALDRGVLKSFKAVFKSNLKNCPTIQLPRE